MARKNSLGRSGPKKPLKPEEEKAVTHLSQIKFHQSFTLPANPANGRTEPFRVTYSDVDYRQSSEDGPTIFFIAGMYGGRYLGAGAHDALARRHRIRLIVVDKFGLGGSPNVALEHRVNGFLDLVPVLLDYLGAKHVAFVSHSAGTIYLFNALIQFRERMHPRNPYACFLSPWVHQSHTGSLGALSVIPDTVIGKSNQIIKFVNQNIAPAISWSTGLFSSNSEPTETDTKAAAPSPGPQQDPIDTQVTQDQEAGDEAPLDDSIDYSPDKDPGPTYLKAAMKYLFAENTDGGAAEAMLCLKRSDSSWGLIEDYEDAMDKIIANEQERNLRDVDGTAGNGDLAVQRAKLLVHVFFPETDMFIGQKGKDWLDDLWVRKRDSSEAFDYQSEVIEGADHDSIAEMRTGVIDWIFAQVRRSWVD